MIYCLIALAMNSQDLELGQSAISELNNLPLSFESLWVRSRFEVWQEDSTKNSFLFPQMPHFYPTLPTAWNVYTKYLLQ